MTVILATTVTRAVAAFVVIDPLTSTDLQRWRDLIEASPGLADATWTAHEGNSPR